MFDDLEDELYQSQDPECPIHHVTLTRDRSYSRLPWSCPVVGCTVIWWGRKGTTPADKETREARKQMYSKRGAQ